jgi:two-component system, OmpR family, response regulator
VAKILLVEDDKTISSRLCEYLKSDKHVVELVERGDDALAMLETYRFDVIILDVGLPDLSGLEVCRRFRETGGATPIIMLTAMGAVSDKERGLDSGADDYLTKPFEPRELSARLRALLRRPHEVMANNVLQVRDLRLDLSKACAFRGEQEIRLLPKEFALLEFLLRRKDHVFGIDSLLDNVWRSDSSASPEAVRQTVARLRSKIDRKDEASIITTVVGLGYTIEAD